MKTIRTITIAVLLIALSFVSNELVAKSFLQPVVSVNGKILESKTEKAIEINIFILNDKGKIIGESKNNKLDGSFFITGLKPGTAYELVFKSKKQTLKTMSIATPLTDKYLELNQDFYLKVQSSELQTLNK